MSIGFIPGVGKWWLSVWYANIVKYSSDTSLGECNSYCYATGGGHYPCRLWQHPFLYPGDSDMVSFSAIHQYMVISDTSFVVSISELIFHYCQFDIISFQNTLKVHTIYLSMANSIETMTVNFCWYVNCMFLLFCMGTGFSQSMRFQENFYCTQRRVQPDQCYFTVHITGSNFEFSL